MTDINPESFLARIAQLEAERDAEHWRQAAAAAAADGENLRKMTGQIFDCLIQIELELMS